MPRAMSISEGDPPFGEGLLNNGRNLRGARRGTLRSDVQATAPGQRHLVRFGASPGICHSPHFRLVGAGSRHRLGCLR
jgi:hypothetical protein